MACWKIFINYGTREEFHILDERVFKSRWEAERFCKSNPLGQHYPLKCVMREEEWKQRKVE
jgi:hypothetical protein